MIPSGLGWGNPRPEEVGAPHDRATGVARPQRRCIPPTESSKCRCPPPPRAAGGARRAPCRWSAAAEEAVAAIELEPRHGRARRHLELLQDVARLRIDPPQLALVALPGAVPQLALGPGDAGDEAVGLDGAQDLSGLGIDLVDLARAILAHPQRALGPRHARIAAVAGGGDRGQHLAGLGIDLLDALLEELEQVRSVERRSRMRVGVDGAHDHAAFGIEGVQPVARGEPDVLAVERQAMHVAGAGEGSVFAEDLGGGRGHDFILCWALFLPKQSLGRCRRHTPTEGSRAAVAVLMTPPSASRTPPHASVGREDDAPPEWRARSISHPTAARGVTTSS